jgi:SIR2-like domain
MPVVDRWVPIAELMLEGKIIPFLGAGASSFHVDPHATNNSDRLGPPTGRRLLDIIAAEAELEIQCRQSCAQPTHNLAQVASYYARVKHSRRQLDSKIARLTGDPTFRPNALHRLLARVALHQPMLLITTNYDTLLEHAFDAAGAPYEVVATAADQLAYSNSGQYGAAREADGPEGAAVGADAGMVYHRLGESSEFVQVPPAAYWPIWTGVR